MFAVHTGSHVTRRRENVSAIRDLTQRHRNSSNVRTILDKSQALIMSILFEPSPKHAVSTHCVHVSSRNGAKNPRKLE
jgi:hypothetical protein